VRFFKTTAYRLVWADKNRGLVLCVKGSIVTDWNKAPNLAQMLFRVSKSNLERVPNDTIIKTSISFSAPFVSLKLTNTCFLLTNIRLCYQSKASLARSS